MDSRTAPGDRKRCNGALRAEEGRWSRWPQVMRVPAGRYGLWWILGNHDPSREPGLDEVCRRVGDRDDPAFLPGSADDEGLQRGVVPGAP